LRAEAVGGRAKWGGQAKLAFGISEGRPSQFGNEEKPSQLGAKQSRGWPSHLGVEQNQGGGEGGRPSRGWSKAEPELSLSRESWSLSKMEGRPKALEPKQNRGEALGAETEQTGGRPWE
jgi:hypothetical protein